jgi:hypothetical protein
MQARFKCDGKIDGKRIKRDGKKDGKNREKVKSGGKKAAQYASIRSMQARFKCGVKLMEKKRRRARKVTERKMDNMHLLEVYKAMRKAGKSEKSDGKKDRQYAFIRSM